MEATNTVSIRLSQDKISAIDSIAKNQEYSRNHVLNQAVHYYLEMHQAWHDGILAALKEVEEEKTLPASEVFSEIRSKFWKS